VHHGDKNSTGCFNFQPCHVLLVCCSAIPDILCKLKESNLYITVTVISDITDASNNIFFFLSCESYNILFI
jgi:hypothetical protein